MATASTLASDSVAPDIRWSATAAGKTRTSDGQKIPTRPFQVETLVEPKAVKLEIYGNTVRPNSQAKLVVIPMILWIMAYAEERVSVIRLHGCHVSGVYIQQ